LCTKKYIPLFLSTFLLLLIKRPRKSYTFSKSLNVSLLYVLDLVLKKNEPKSRSEQEIAGYRDALALIHESSEYIPFTVNILLQLHSTLYRYMSQNSGRYKVMDNEIVDKIQMAQ
jgi:hypothetical protein